MAKPNLHVVSEPFKIEIGVPPPSRAKTGMTSAMRELVVAPIGASFMAPEMGNIRSAAYETARRVGGPGWVSVKTVEGGIRVWKVSEPKTRA